MCLATVLVTKYGQNRQVDHNFVRAGGEDVPKEHLYLLEDQHGRQPEFSRIIVVPGETPMSDQITCSNCKQSFNSGMVICPHCGQAQWGSIIAIHFFWMVCAGLFFFLAPRIGPGFFRSIIQWITGILGAICLVGGVSYTYSGLRSKKHAVLPLEPAQAKPTSSASGLRSEKHAASAPSPFQTKPASSAAVATPPLTLPPEEIDWEVKDIAAANQAFFEKAGKIFWDYEHNVNIWRILSDCAEELGGWYEPIWMDVKGNKDHDDREYRLGKKTAMIEGCEIFWPQNPGDDSGFANLNSIMVNYHSDGRLEIVSGSGVKTTSQFSINPQMITEACKTPFVQRIAVSENRKANLEYFTNAPTALKPFKMRFIEMRGFGEIKETNLIEDGSNRRYYQGLKKVPSDFAKIWLEWTLKIDEGRTSDHVKKGRITVGILADGRVEVKSGWGRTTLSLEKGSSAPIVNAAIDRACQHPEEFAEVYSHPASDA
jgi:hypothetical protein